MNFRTLIFFLILVPIMFIGMTIYLFVNLIDRSGDSFYRLAAWWGRFSAKLFGISVEVIGRENYSSDQNYLLVSNHAGMADIPLILGNIAINLRFLAKEELGKIPIFGWTLKLAGYVMIKRGQNRDALKSLLAASNVLKKGRSVHIFPEGTRSFDGKLLPFKRGAFLVAEKGGAPVLPVTIIGSHLITPKKSLKINKGKIRIIIAPPIPPSQFQSVEELKNTCAGIIGSNLEKYSYN
ncbi:1-acyl-sn-glycerol-3-phosphate acyltransferase [Chlorobium sp. BLA1]|uniref:lysophospholipid acyltransferase family protein n=1 Tax=Candidatus Chlorobium masyuteum TaxID=2716876 RepID=UPI0014204594|nr:lysophospholipid acyltransferase family protein [Candidatus Chlorobium masyuteum]NHQ59786.1 1-acyl-sn-glycerol-3-phosphate acyltransferase [Candidatus Chlorobium masyuteum]NTU44933.1 1-acyl-sn-glycerol-3-phosphate acyltransferase [Chlorobiaceae bacterium]